MVSKKEGVLLMSEKSGPKDPTIKVGPHKAAFERAIKQGLKNPEDYMYMYTKDGKDYFKHIDTREYKKFKGGGKVRLF
jgi:hypothetical protein